jgi:competence protein ComEC
VAAAAGLWAVLTPRPDVLVAGDGQAAAFRGSDGRLAVLYSGRDSFAVKEWLAADADARTPKDPSLANGVTCDTIGCIGKLGDGRLISMVLALEAFAEDCTRAAVVVSLREALSPNCVATLIDRNVWRASGAVSLYWTGNAFEQTVALPRRYDRPWGHGSISAAASTTPTSAASTDAAPRAEDLDSDD